MAQSRDELLNKIIANEKANYNLMNTQLRVQNPQLKYLEELVKDYAKQSIP